MALINCYECSGPVSTAAASCPRCGAPMKQVKRTSSRIAKAVISHKDDDLVDFSDLDNSKNGPSKQKKNVSSINKASPMEEENEVGIPCDICRDGELVETTVNRWHKGLVVIGQLLLFIALGGIFVTVIGLLDINSTPPEKKDPYAELRAKGLSEELIKKVKNKYFWSDEELLELSDNDRKLVMEGNIIKQMESDEAFAEGVVSVFGKGALTCIGFSSLPLGLLALLLLMKKPVLLCNFCGHYMDVI